MILAARGLVGISRADLARASGIAVETLKQMESNGCAWLQSEGESEAVSRELERFGVIFIPESDGMGAGVRLLFKRQDIRQISSLENEGASRRMTTYYDLFTFISVRPKNPLRLKKCCDKIRSTLGNPSLTGRRT